MVVKTPLPEVGLVAAAGCEAEDGPFVVLLEGEVELHAVTANAVAAKATMIPRVDLYMM